MRSSLHALLLAMHARGWLAIDDPEAGVRYRIGAQALTVGAAFLSGDDIVARSSPVSKTRNRYGGGDCRWSGLGLEMVRSIFWVASRTA